MKDGLHSKLNNWIKSEQGRVVSIDSIERQVKLWGYKISNYERRLRPSESPDIERIMKNGAIVGYRYNPKVENLSPFMQKWNAEFKKEEKVTENRLF